MFQSWIKVLNGCFLVPINVSIATSNNAIRNQFFINNFRNRAPLDQMRITAFFSNLQRRVLNMLSVWIKKKLLKTLSVMHVIKIFIFYLENQPCFVLQIIMCLSYIKENPNNTINLFIVAMDEQVGIKWQLLNCVSKV